MFIRKITSAEGKKSFRKPTLGAALAHITLWEYSAEKAQNELFLVLEDNALATKITWKGIFFSNIYNLIIIFEYEHMGTPMVTRLEHQIHFALEKLKG